MDTVHSHGWVIADGVRTGCYERALRATVRPGDVVLDLGTGTGIFAVVACQAGARRVFAVEFTDAIWAAREVARANGCAERIMFIQDLSTRIDLPEKAHVIVSEIHGALPMYKQGLRSLIDARTRHLCPGGAILPRRDQVWIALVEAAEFYELRTGVWRRNPAGVDLSTLRPHSVNLPFHCHVAASQLIGEPRLWATLDYRTLDTTHVAGTARWQVENAATAHGLLAWFDCELSDDIAFSSHPAQPPTIFGQLYLPWLEPVSLQPGDYVEVSVRADPGPEDYCFRWDTTVWDSKRTAKANFRQSNFLASTISPDELRKRASAYTPRLSPGGEVERFVLEMMDGRRSLADIAASLQQRHPGLFTSRQEALDRVADISRRCSE